MMLLLNNQKNISYFLSVQPLYWVLTHYHPTILDSPKQREFADDNFKFDEIGRKLSKRVENTVGKGEIARYEQFLLFPQGFQKVSLCGNGLRHQMDTMKS